MSAGTVERPRALMPTRKKEIKGKEKERWGESLDK